jgi:RNA polymerase sigma-70 factor (ECF subfamily)
MQSNSKKTDIFFQLYIKHQKRIYAYILMFIPNVSDADDVLQQVSSCMWERFDSFEPESNFGAWAIRIARNFVFDHYKSKRRSKILFTDQNFEVFADRAAESSSLMDQRVEFLHKCLEEFKDSDRKLLKARYEEGLKIKEIAQLIGRPLEGLYKAMNRIHNALIQCIRREMSARGVS